MAPGCLEPLADLEDQLSHGAQNLQGDKVSERERHRFYLCVWVSEREREREESESMSRKDMEQEQDRPNKRAEKGVCQDKQMR